MFEVGDVVAGYTVDEFLGGGATADVFRVHRGDDRPVALKVLHPKGSDPSRMRERFDREFTIARKLDHPHIVKIYARGEVDDPDTAPALRRPHYPALWMAMQYVPGSPATTLIPHDAEPDVPAILRIAAQIASALDYAHGQEILHRDVKPANILTTPTSSGLDGFLSDFGIAQFLDDTRPLARNGRVQGSIAYAAPELLQAQQLSPATDLYAFACSLVELLTGFPPYPRTTAFAITYAHINDDPPKLTRRRRWLPSAVDSIFAKALAKSPTDRYSSCGELVEIITRLMRDVPIPDTPPHRLFGRSRTRR
ncbi:serine/threonine-protein kinase [Gordonia sp. ABSL49_1]|uniref:serine/threonine-protein kinase n=1 Tax=Gordonia sp. ABSL49_1 TaxID=2920941 RepID=UPI001F0D2B0C|nr:serine/threonine-protein kinase [Gordonia sp. ABSL49_1]MCH5643297.1 serine/threonine protein kinase [Gordonia sp. ABSL49_1]